MSYFLERHEPTDFAVVKVCGQTYDQLPLSRLHFLKRYELASQAGSLQASCVSVTTCLRIKGLRDVAMNNDAILFEQS